MRIVFIQFGDFRSAHQDFAEHGTESYHAQRYSMEIVEDLAREGHAPAVICVASEPYQTPLETGIMTYGMDLFGNGRPDYASLWKILSDLAPSHIVLRFPDGTILNWCLRRKFEILPSFADTFASGSGLKARIRNWRLAWALNAPRIRWIGNHNIAACADLVRIGVDPAKIVPWDWPRSPTPDEFEPRKAPAAPPWKLLFVGSVSESKGVGDLIRAMGADYKLAQNASLTIAGPGDIDAMKSLAAETGVADRVSFTGKIPFREVLPTMRAHNAVIVCTRAGYGEGLPGTIYQALAARTPLVLSDHPVFVDYFSQDEDAVFARESDPRSLADAIISLLENKERYERLSVKSAAVFERICHPTHWVEFVRRWIDGDDQWLAQRNLPHFSSSP